MNTHKFRNGLATIAASAVLGLATTQTAIAGPGTLPNAPLFLSTAVEPNVFFTLDDSGSMDNVFIFKDTAGISSLGGQPLDDSGDYIGYFHPTWSKLYAGDETLPPSNGTQASWDKYWVVRNHHGNKIYYNPDTTYKPWVGVDASGNALYREYDPVTEQVPKDPNNPTGEKTWLTTDFNFGGYTAALYLPTYFVWNDDGDGVMEQSDGRTMVEIRSTTPTYTSPGGIVRTYQEEIQNFANWFVYYRSRNNATKAAIGEVINNNSTTRMGLEYFNNTLSRFGVKTMSSDANKLDILTTFYSLVIPARGTPARRSLQSVGQYFESTSGSPILPQADGGECQQNFNILMTDGFWNGSNPTGIADEDSDDNTDFDGPNAVADGGNYADSESRTLADVAMYFYENDLITGLDNKVPIKDGIDVANHQHLVTYTVSFGLEGTLDTTIDPTDAAFPGWPNAHNGDDEKVDDLVHAAYNGRGKYLSANNAEQLKTSLETAISDIDAQTATAAAVSINSAKLTTESTVFLAEFNSGGWQGDLKAVRIEDQTTGALETEKDPITGLPLVDVNGDPILKSQWEAAKELDDLNAGTDKSNASAVRQILTYNGTTGIPFQWADVTTAQKADLNTSPVGTTDALGERRLNYIRGSQVDEGSGNPFRERSSLLGDLVSSAPVFVGEPNLRWPDKAPFPTASGSRYSDFKNGAAKNRDGVVYVGSNDGMIHGFVDKDAASGGGKEVIAYIPSNLFSTATDEGLHYLTDPSYAHRFYNDLTPTLSDVYINSSWKTVLISGQRSGGRGISALDVTDPSIFSETNASSIVLWEFNDTDDANLGFTFSKPQIGIMNDGSWVAIFGNGYNDSGDGEAKLFILDIQLGIGGNWTLGTNYRVISTGVGSTTDRNGLATPALADLDGNGTIDRAYAGDLKGNMWAFDLSSSTPASWGVGFGGNASGGDPLFTTVGGLPITAKPTLAKHPTITSTTGNDPNVMVFFGSGQYLVDADITTTNTNHFYGVWDRGDANRTSANLVEQTYDTSFTQRVLTRNQVNYNGGEYGWYFGLSNSASTAGERSVTSPVVRGGVIFFNSFIPGSDPCLVGGFGFRFAVDIVTGGSTEESVVDVDGDGDVDDDDLAVSGSNTAGVAAIQQEGFLPEPVFIEDIAYTADTPTKVIKLKDLPTGRFSWQELLQ